MYNTTIIYILLSNNTLNWRAVYIYENEGDNHHKADTVMSLYLTLTMTWTLEESLWG